MGRKFVERMKIANSLIDASPVTYFACNDSSHVSFCYKSMFLATPHPFSRSTTKIVLLFHYCSSCAGYDVLLLTGRCNLRDGGGQILLWNAKRLPNSEFE